MQLTSKNNRPWRSKLQAMLAAGHHRRRGPGVPLIPLPIPLSVTYNTLLMSSLHHIIRVQYFGFLFGQLEVPFRIYSSRTQELVSLIS